MSDPKSVSSYLEWFAKNRDRPLWQASRDAPYTDLSIDSGADLSEMQFVADAKPITLWEDNQSTIHLTRGHTLHKASKHIAI